MRLRAFKITYSGYILIAFLLLGCGQTRNIPNKKYLLKANVIKMEGDLSESEAILVVRQQPNFKTLGIKLKLWAFNHVDSAKVAQKRIRLNKKASIKNDKLIAKAKKINDSRIKRAYARNARAGRKVDSTYIQKIPKLEDTLLPKRFMREWVKYKYGEPPVVYDSILQAKSKVQLAIWCRNKGFYKAFVEDTVIYNEKKRTATSIYTIKTNKPTIIDSFYVNSINKNLADSYYYMLKKRRISSLVGKRLDAGVLDAHRFEFARLCRDVPYYNFLGTNVTYTVFPNSDSSSVTVSIDISERAIVEKTASGADTVVYIPFDEKKILDVHYHLLDTSFFDSDTTYSDFLKLKNSTISSQDRRIQTFDYLYVMGEGKSDGSYRREGHFHYNRKMFLKPDILDFQSLLENDFYFREKYQERSYSNFLRLGVFKSITPVYIEDKKTGKIEVHYYLVPAEKQYFSFEPRATNSNGFLGIAAGMNWTNKNLFRRAERLTTSVSGGFESQPPIFEESVDGSKTEKAARSFNTFEIGPTVTLDIPWFFPIKIKNLEKRQNSRSSVALAYNYAQRTDFIRHVVGANFGWKFEVDKWQEYQVGVPLMSAVKLVEIRKSDEFAAKIDASNDLFLRNSYSGLSVWQDLMVRMVLQNTKNEKRKINFPIYFKLNFDLAGVGISAFKSTMKKDAFGNSLFLGVPFSQFARFDTEYKVFIPVQKRVVLALRAQTGIGLPFGNTKISMPFDYGFFGGGANDNRGFRARTLGPGVYKSYLNSSRTATEIGDLQLTLNAEARLKVNDMLGIAFFSDIGNIWTRRIDVNRVGSEFSSNFYKQLAVAAGLGFRLDFNFFIIRLDVGIPLRVPSLPENARWLWSSRELYYQEGLAAFGPDYKSKLPKPFRPQIHFGIGLPF